MTNQNTINKLMEMCLFATVDAFRNQLTNTGMTDTSLMSRGECWSISNIHVVKQMSCMFSQKSRIRTVGC